MSKIGFLVIALTALGLMVLSVWRDRRSARWRSLGLCHQCGATLGAGTTTVAQHLLSPRNKVRICGGCAQERRIRRWMLTSFALLGLIAMAIWWWVRQA
jgi:MFS-type transporter involved in bile tolerance (Atg22 family)